MDGYNAMICISKEKPEYISIVKKCVESHHTEEKKQHSLAQVYQCSPKNEIQNG